MPTFRQDDDSGSARKRRPELVTRLAVHDAEGVRIRGKSLAEEIIGQWTFTQLLYFCLRGRQPTASETAVLDACLVSLMEAGINASSVTTRLVASSAPSQMQVALAAGLLTVGDVYAGSTEGCAELLVEISDDTAGGRDRSRRIVRGFADRGEPVPGFGHGTHTSDDPRARALLRMVRDRELDTRYVDSLTALSGALDESRDKHLPVNVTGAIAALLLTIGLPPEAMRGISATARCGGLVGHALEERETRSARRMWRSARDDLEYRDPDQQDTRIDAHENEVQEKTKE